MRLDLIIRTSKRKQDAKSPAQQRQLAESVAQIHGYEIVAVHDSGVDESGKTMARPSIEAARERIRSGETDGIIVGLLDRIGRAPIEEAMTVLREIHAEGGVFVPADAGGLPVDLDDPQAETNLVLQLQIARQYWVAAQRRFRLSQSNAVERGVAPWPKIPPGYLRGPDGVLVPDPKLAPVIARAFELRAGGAPVQDVRVFLAEHGVRRSYAAVVDMLRSRVYVGEIHFGDLHNPEAHRPIVEREIFERVGRLVISRGRYAKSQRLLARLGVLRCQSCGSRMIVNHQRGDRGAFYRCGSKYTDCPARSTIMAHIVEPLVSDYVLRKIANVEGHASIEADYCDAEAALAAAETNLDDFAELFAAVITRPRMQAKVAELTALVEAAAERVEHLARTRAALSVLLGRDWTDLTLAEQRGFITDTIGRVDVAPGRSADGGRDRLTIEPLAK